MSIIDQAKAEVEGILTKIDPEVYKYHNLNHTSEVVEISREIASNLQLSEEEIEIVLIAAWFHDAGYSLNYTDHEAHSQKLAREFLEKHSYPEEKIKKVENCIEATRFPQKPTDELSKVLCDADMAHMRNNDFLEKSENLRQEISAINKVDVKKKFFCKKTLSFMEDQDYFTDYAKNEFTPGKTQNYEAIKSMANTKDNSKKIIETQQKKIAKLEQKLAKQHSPERGIESMFRNTARSQINLSSIADNKANILITVNSIIISVLASFVQRIIAQNPSMLVPMFIILSTSLVTIIFAILATRPKLSKGKFTKEDIMNKKVNLMFFGNFYGMKYEEYEWALKEVMKDYDGLYNTMIRDQYSLGVVLATKYNRIRTAYNTFMFGLITFVISIIVVQLTNLL